MDTRKQLENVSQLNVYKYKYNEDFAEHAGLTDDELEDTGVLAQEVQEVLPDAVRDTGDVILKDGKRIENFLVINKVGYKQNIWQGSHPTWKTLKTRNFIICFARCGKCMEFAQKEGKTWNFNSQPGKNLNLKKIIFPD